MAAISFRQRWVKTGRWLKWWQKLTYLPERHRIMCQRLFPLSQKILSLIRSRPCHILSLTATWWRHQMETFPHYWPFVRGIHRSPMNSPHKGQWRKALMFSLICAWTNNWVNNRNAFNLRCHRAHYDVTVINAWTTNVLPVNVFAFIVSGVGKYISIDCSKAIPNN